MSSPRSEVDEEEVQLTNQLTEIREVRRKQGRRLTQTGEEGGGPGEEICWKRVADSALKRRQPSAVLSAL